MSKVLVFFLSVGGGLFIGSLGNASATITVGEIGLNTPFVSVAVCDQKNKCQNIDNIKLDTGSVGLRIFKKALNLQLAPVADSTGQAISVCQGFGGGNSMWGSLVKANLQFGGAAAEQVSVQIVENPSGSACAGAEAEPSADEGNGLMGVGLTRTDGNGASYFTCAETVCSPYQVLDSQRLPNPLLAMKNVNGMVIDFAAVPFSGTTSIVGQLILGVGDRSENTPAAGIAACQAPFKARLAGQDYFSSLDSGTNAFNFPAAVNSFTHCPNNSVYLCPTDPVALTTELIDASGRPCSEVDFSFSDAHYYWWPPGHHVFSNIAEQWGAGTSHSLTLGLPFFFGRKIYFVFEGETSPLGVGPLVAF